MITFVTTNPGKFREVSARLAPLGVRLRRLDRAYPEVQADRLEDVVRHGARVLSRQLRGEFLIDDSGLFVDALGGFPGVYSAHVYRTIGPEGVLALMRGEAHRAARFETVLLLGGLGRPSRVFKGVSAGSIARTSRGRGGFGFDPIFAPEGHRRTFGEMSLGEKNALSHRARAVDALAAHLGRRGR
ncbi:MAG: non-canonical purine NTP pyrophosphatase, RdgB/HAM1 family [Euryarchaeota archaeon RBG_16_68_12]|nr:MAG: non-canonical purine NTP pyrophosphatase, RdgB/HAM1 family [Euryarchaeota archaeon RBG_16_68_12]